MKPEDVDALRVDRMSAEVRIEIVGGARLESAAYARFSYGAIADAYRFARNPTARACRGAAEAGRLAETTTGMAVSAVIRGAVKGT